MLIRPRKKATTTLGVREYLRARPKGIETLARELNLNLATVRKWRGRESVQDASRRPHMLQTTLSPAQEIIVVALRDRATPFL